MLGISTLQFSKCVKWDSENLSGIPKVLPVTEKLKYSGTYIKFVWSHTFASKTSRLSRKVLLSISSSLSLSLQFSWGCYSWSSHEKPRRKCFRHYDVITFYICFLKWYCFRASLYEFARGNHSRYLLLGSVFNDIMLRASNWHDRAFTWQRLTNTTHRGFISIPPYILPPPKNQEKHFSAYHWNLPQWLKIKPICFMNTHKRIQR